MEPRRGSSTGAPRRPRGRPLALALGLIVNHLVLEQIEYDRVDTTAARAEREAFVAKQPLGGAADASARVVSAEREDGESKSPYAGRIFVLVDHGSGSSGESAAHALRIALGATVVDDALVAAPVEALLPLLLKLPRPTSAAAR